MANKAYRSIAAGNWSNSTGTVWAVYSTTASGGVFPAGTWSTAAANDYPTTGDYVWIQSTFAVVYDATAIAANNSATFALISGNIAANGSAIAQPGTGGVNLTTGFINLSTNGTNTTINATYYSVLSGSAGLFQITTSSTTFNFTGYIYEGTSGIWLYSTAGSGNTVNVTSNVRGGSTSGGTINLGAASTTLNLIGDATGKGASAIAVSGTSCVANITGNVYGSDTVTGAYGFSTTNANGICNVTITGNTYSGVNSSAVYAPNIASSVTVTGNIQNYGSSGVTAYSAIISGSINLRSTATLGYRTSDAGVKNFTTSGATTVTEASIWSYATRVLTAATNITSNGSTIDQTKIANIDTTISSRLATSGYTAPDNTTIGTINTKLGTPSSSVSADIATRASQTSVNSIPTNPLLTTDTRLNNLDASISSRLASASYTVPDNATIGTINTKIGTPTTNLANDINIIGTNTTNIPNLVAQVVGHIVANLT